jgi:guanosine-3',5'-bis(diphosphate) 3'-pyrophosphohydrolase
MIRFEDIIEKVVRNCPDADKELLRRAYFFSAREHRGQIRKSGEPYLLHPLEVANILADLRLDPECIIAGLLHDVVEDTRTPIKSIEELFGTDIARMVEGLTKIARLDNISYEERQALNMRKMLLAIAEDVRVVLVKLADRLHNMRTLQYLAAEKRRLIARETLDVYAPIAHMLGIGRLQEEMEDLAFKFLEPDNYQELRAAVENRRPRSEAFMKRVEQQIRKIMSDADIRITNVEPRIRQLYPLYQRLKRHQMTIDQVHDLVTVGIITESVKDCYSTLGIIHAAWKPIPNSLQDMIALPRENFYQAIHTSVICEGGQFLEVQIRTEEMNRIAVEGITARWKYKGGRRNIHHEKDEAFLRLKQVIEWQDEVEDSHEFLGLLKLDLSQKKICCLTPKGKAIELPQGATPIDFAFAIHTELGLHCAGARANGLNVPLKYQLCEGDVLEIVSSPNTHPSRDWMNFIKTPRARSSLRRYFVQSERASAINLGKRLLEKEATNLHLNTGIIFANGALERLAHKYGFTRLEALLAAIGYGKILPSNIIKRTLPPEQAAQIKDINRTEHRKNSDQMFNLQPFIRAIGIDDLMIYGARCCSPIRGEKIIGYVKRGKGIIVHSAGCPNTPGLLVNPDRTVEVKWMKEEGENQLSYRINLRLIIEDRTDIIVDMTRAIASIDTNLRDLHTAIDEQGHTNLFITAEIFDFHHLEKLTKVLKAVKGVLDLERIKHASLRK